MDMKTSIIKFIIENYMSLLIMSMLILLAIFILDKKINDTKIEVNKKVKNNFLSEIDLISSRIGGIVIIVILLFVWIVNKLQS